MVMSDLILGFVLKDLLVFGDGLRDFCLVQELLRRFDEFIFVKAMLTSEKSPSDSLRDFLLGLSAAMQTRKQG